MPRICPVCTTTLTDTIDVCTACGFKLKGSTQSFAPVTSQLPAADANERHLPTQAFIRTSLRIIKGPQNPNAYPILEDITTIGRNPNCDIFLNDMTVSRLHARILKMDDCYMIEDNKSYNGVWVNNVNTISRKLKNGDLIQIGAFSLVFEQE